MQTSRLPRILTVLSSLTLAACGGVGANVSGQLGATATGDLSNAPAERRDGRLDLLQACAPPSGASAAFTFQRTPYLQRVTQTSADVSWLGESDEELSPLAAQTVYCYDISAAGVAPERLGFRTAPAPNTSATVRFLAFGDSGAGGGDQNALHAQMATVPFDLIIHTGDIAYENGTRVELERNFFTPYADYLKFFPVFPASGNHEYNTDDAQPFRDAFVLPENGGPDGIERWYSFDWGDVHFVALDTERTGPVQAAWLDADLTANQRPWTIVYGHRPPFSSGDHGSDGAFQTHFVPVLEKHAVPLVLSGHDHDYERTFPRNGVTYVVTGGGGVGVRPVGSSSFTAFSNAVIHFVYVTVSGNELALHAIDGLGNEFDSLVIRR